MQLYEVSFQVTFANCIDSGSAIVCAQDQKKAKEMVIGLLELAPSAISQCEANRVKPNLYLVRRTTEAVAPKPQVQKPSAPPIAKLSVVSGPIPSSSYQPSRKGLRAIASQSKARREHEQGMRALAAQQQWAQEAGGQQLDEIKYDCRVVARIEAPDDDTALRRLGRELINRSDELKKGKPNDRVYDVMINLDPQFGRIARRAPS